MGIDAIIITISSIIIGAIIAWIIARFYYLRSRNIRSITPYVNYISKVFSDIDPELKKDLKIKYKGTEVDNFYQVQFTIINTGNRSLNNFIKPLTLIIPNNGEILDVKILHIHPKGREITFNIRPGKNFISYNIPLLNSGEYFVTKLLIKGDVESDKDFIFKVSAEDLPPEILSAKPLILPKKGKVETIITMVIMVIIFTSIIISLSFLKKFGLLNIFLIIMACIIAVFIVFNVLILIFSRSKDKYSEILKKFSK